MKKDRNASTLSAVAVIPAAGKGHRMGGRDYKQFLEINGKPILTLTLEKFQACPSIQAIIVIVPSHQVETCQRKVITPYSIKKVQKVLAGGERRQDSVRLGIESSGGKYDLVVIHDGVRPFVAPQLVENMVSLAKEHRALTAGIPAKDTIKEVGEDGLVRRTHNREGLWMVQTPQVFHYQDILEAHHEALRKEWGDVTDDAQMVERMGIPVKVIEGSEMNIKVTTPGDLALARYLLKAPEGSEGRI
ncbi:MAG: 2-C-methyl-D-erythritol 4-phosphate cytidylyltransferase [Deltaproteobacteria bacterium]|nr:2-C-methyl-D-erythritol 4-phosphate cytidylyltransferase [Deltaproteobacteria bacterium]